jgi:trypsin
MRFRMLAALTVATVIAAVVPVLTVTNGQPDGNLHPYVGTVIQFIDANTISICSGSALSPTRFLTAAHCADPGQPVFVSYKSGSFTFPTDFTQGTFVPNPNWCPNCGHGVPGFDSHDVAIVRLVSAVNPGGFVTLPSAGLVDTLPMNSPIDLVGYGVQGFVHGGGKPQDIFLFTRFFAPSLLIQSNDAISDEFIKLTANPAQGKGGICFGDSGGPDLIGGTTTVVAVNTFLNDSNCAGVTYSQRIDLPDILSFIHGG